MVRTSGYLLLMMQILHDLIYQNAWNYVSIACMKSCRIYIINSRTSFKYTYPLLEPKQLPESRQTLIDAHVRPSKTLPRVLLLGVRVAAPGAGDSEDLSRLMPMQ